MPAKWITSLNWMKPDIQGNKISKHCPNILQMHALDRDARSDRNITGHVGVSKQILKALTMMPYLLHDVGIISPITSHRELEFQVEMMSDSLNDNTHVLTLSTGTDNAGNKKATLYHRCKGLSDDHPCYHMIMGLIIYDLYSNQGNEFHTHFRKNDIHNWNPVGLLRTADEFYFDMKSGKVPIDLDILGSISKRPFVTDLKSFIIYGSPVETNIETGIVSIDQLLSIMNTAANISFK
ncbi:hypothetical protein METP3_01225 [Methanosarcinales archaeon]|nr:MAG: hypothetical protein OI861_00175 [Candidatus Methanoperedens sp.]CAG0967319.1 hypothetical protein METP3_01225 [Methanosarcinales archaeon]